METIKNQEDFSGHQGKYRCPVCGQALARQDSSLVCPARHCFDLCKKGYVNFLSGPAAKKNKYDKALFESRNKVFGAGFYDGVLKALEMMIRKYSGGKPAVILDVGCGEGFYINRLAGQGQWELFGLDNVKEAVAMACRERKTVGWMVGNLADIPMLDGAVDVLLNILTPANYEEFGRVLSQEGIVVKVIPGQRYLREIRQCVAGQLAHKEYTNEETVSYFAQRMEVLERREVCQSFPVTREQAAEFLRMTPMTFHVDTAAVDPGEISQITIHLEFLIGKPKRDALS